MANFLILLFVIGFPPQCFHVLGSLFPSSSILLPLQFVYFFHSHFTLSFPPSFHTPYILHTPTHSTSPPHPHTLPVEYTRVSLHPIEGVDGSEYINANYIAVSHYKPLTFLPSRVQLAKLKLWL